MGENCDSSHDQYVTVSDIKLHSLSTESFRGFIRLCSLPTRLLACDMDGTLLDSRSRVLPSTVDALRAALARGVTVVLATGKARPAAIAAMETVGLAGDTPAMRGDFSAAC